MEEFLRFKFFPRGWLFARLGYLWIAASYFVYMQITSSSPPIQVPNVLKSGTLHINIATTTISTIYSARPLTM